MYNQMRMYEKVNGMLIDGADEVELVEELLKSWICTSDYLIKSSPDLDKELAGELAMQFTKDLKAFTPNQHLNEKDIQWTEIGGLFFLFPPSLPFRYNLDNTKLIVDARLSVRFKKARREARQMKHGL